MTYRNPRNPKRPRKPAGGSLLRSLRNAVRFTSASRAVNASGETPSRGTRAMTQAIAVASLRRMIV
jgi:hypothetical protein